jgi:hypothetical protein
VFYIVVSVILASLGAVAEWRSLPSGASVLYASEGVLFAVGLGLLIKRIRTDGWRVVAAVGVFVALMFLGVAFEKWVDHGAAAWYSAAVVAFAALSGLLGTMTGLIGTILEGLSAARERARNPGATTG